MSETVEEKIEKLAQSLKSMHLAASMEEALARAKEIILGTKTDEKKSVNELVEEQKQEKKENNNGDSDAA